jgi:RNA polymerase sigma factor (sigma-70 family)
MARGGTTEMTPQAKRILGTVIGKHMATLCRLAERRMGSGMRGRFRASDIVQSVAKDALQTQAPLDSEAAALAFLTIRIGHKCKDKGRWLKARRRDVDREESVPGAPAEADGFDLAAASFAYATDAQREEYMKILEDAMSFLSVPERELFELRHLDGLSLDELVARFGVAKHAAACRLSRALHKVKHRLMARLAAQSL